jgi:hypothetical protein
MQQRCEQIAFLFSCPTQDEIQEIDAYLEKMGVKDAALRRRLETQMPYASEQAVSSALSAANRQESVVALNAAAGKEGAAHAEHLPALVVCSDANGGFAGLEPLLAAMEMPCYGVRVPQVGAKGPLLHTIARDSLVAGNAAW